MIVVTFTGLEEARAYLATLKNGAEAAGRITMLVGSPLGYARYQEFGTRHFRGRYYLTNAARQELRGFDTELAHVLDRGGDGAAVFATFQRRAFRVQRAAQAGAPVKTGTLRRSIHTVAGRR